MDSYSVETVTNWQFRVYLLRDMAAVLWVVSVANWVIFQKTLYLLCIPRTLPGLFGIVLAPIIHGSFEHLLVNTLSFSFLAYLLLLKGLHQFLGVVAVIWVIEGFLVWLTASSNPHIGISGVIYGLFSYLLLISFLSKEPIGFVVATAVGVTHWKMAKQLFKEEEGVSGTSHMAGFVAGIGAALFQSGMFS